MKADCRQLVAIRTGQRCTYCRMHQELQGAEFQVEHIGPRKLNRTTEHWYTLRYDLVGVSF